MILYTKEMLVLYHNSTVVFAMESLLAREAGRIIVR